MRTTAYGPGCDQPIDLPIVGHVVPPYFVTRHNPAAVSQQTRRPTPDLDLNLLLNILMVFYGGVNGREIRVVEKIGITTKQIGASKNIHHNTTTFLIGKNKPFRPT